MFPQGSGPIADLSGKECGAGQSGAVWFLAGTYESRPVHRSCEVPAGTHIFFPVINYVATWPNATDLNEVTACENAKRVTQRLTDPAMVLTAELDGVQISRIERYRQTTPDCFNLAAAVPGAPAIVASSNGYWVMLKPLSPGRHSLKFGAVLPSLQQGVVYDLLVRGDRSGL